MNARFVVTVSLLSSSLLLAVACGSTGVGDDLIAEPDGGDAAVDPSGGGGGNGGGAGTGTGDGGGARGGDSGASTGPDGGIDPPDAGPGGDTSSVTCGSTSCALPDQQCCVTRVARRSTGYACADATDGGTCPQPANGGDVTSLGCSAQANCAAGTVCCVTQTNNGAASECKASCGKDEAQLCDPTAADPGCPQQDPCSGNNIRDWGLPSSYATCGGVGN